MVIGIPNGTRGHVPFAVLRSLGGKSPRDIDQHVEEVLGEQYSLSGLVTFEELGLTEFPVNATHKIMRSEVEALLLKYLELNQA